MALKEEWAQILDYWSGPDQKKKKEKKKEERKKLIVPELGRIVKERRNLQRAIEEGGSVH